MGSGKKVTMGYHYRPAHHAGLCKGPIDAFLEFRAADKVAWKGLQSESGTISVNAPNLFGGEKDQGGISGDMDVMFGEADQEPNAYLLATFGSQVPAWRGIASVVFKGGRYGAMNPYPPKGSYKVRKTVAGWDDDECWYPEKAAIPMLTFEPVALYFAIDLSGSMNTMTSNGQTRLANMKTAINACLDMIKASLVDAGALVDIMVVGWGTPPDVRQSIIRRGISDAGGIEDLKTWVSGRVAAYDTFFPAGVMDIEAFLAEVPSNYIQRGFFITDGVPGAAGYTASENANAAADIVMANPSMPVYGINIDLVNTTWTSLVSSGSATVPVVEGNDPSALTDVILGILSGISGMNPAHLLYFSRTNGEMGRELISNINDDSLRAAADWYYTQGFGLCATRDPSQESPDDFEQRICKAAGCSFERSLSDGQWYIDIANGVYDLESLPILSDDDILDFKELPSTLDNATNSVSVKYFDVLTKEKPTTPPARALGLVTSFGPIHQTNEYSEIPTGGLALRVAGRDLLGTVTPTRAFELATTRKTYAWRKNQYFRLQSEKRGVADMVCIVGELETGSLRSGAIKLKAVQDIYSLPDAVYVESEPGVDTRPSQTPVAIATQRVIETPYIDVVAALSAAERDVLDIDTGFALSVAMDNARSVDFSMRVAPDGDVVYTEVGTGDFCPTALVVEEADDKTETGFTMADGIRLDQVEIGTAVLWDDEICRVDDIDVDAGTISLGRGCADTVSALHSAGSRLWFYQAAAAIDETEYTAGETIDVKLLPNTGSRQLAEGDATPMSLTFDQRWARPYPPGNVRLNGTPYLATVSGALTVTWAHRDRLQQADQLIDTTAGSIGPETDTRSTLQFYDDMDALIIEREDIGLPTAVVVLDYTGAVTMRLFSVSDVGPSWQVHEHTFAYTPPGGASSITATDYVPYVPTWEIDGNGG